MEKERLKQTKIGLFMTRLSIACALRLRDDFKRYPVPVAALVVDKWSMVKTGIMALRVMILIYVCFK